MEPRIERIRRFYDNLDRNDVDNAITLFSREIRYERGSRRFEGFEAVRDFYRCGRSATIETGVHVLQSASEQNGIVSVIGEFVGTLAGHRKAVIAFEDRFEFDGDVVARRVSTFPAEEI